MSDNMSAALVILFFAVIAGITMILVGFQARNAHRRMVQKQSAATTGTIVDRVEKHAHNPRAASISYWVPVIRYVVDGQEYSEECRIGSDDEQKIVIGRTVEVLYDPSDPRQYHTPDDVGDEVAGKRFIIIGAVIIAAGLAFLALHH